MLATEQFVVARERIMAGREGVGANEKMGALDGWFLMLPDDFKKCQYRMSLSLIYAHVAAQFKKYPCRMSLYFWKTCQ